MEMALPGRGSDCDSAQGWEQSALWYKTCWVRPRSGGGGADHTGLVGLIKDCGLLSRKTRGLKGFNYTQVAVRKTDWEDSIY